MMSDLLLHAIPYYESKDQFSDLPPSTIRTEAYDEVAVLTAMGLIRLNCILKAKSLIHALDKGFFNRCY